jgi:hypothetical protein
MGFPRLVDVAVRFDDRVVVSRDSPSEDKIESGAHVHHQPPLHPACPLPEVNQTIEKTQTSILRNVQKSAAKFESER